MIKLFFLKRFDKVNHRDKEMFAVESDSDVGMCGFTRDDTHCTMFEKITKRIARTVEIIVVNAVDNYKIFWT